ncbi:MAG: hypothetical protein WA118_14430 [Carboxydocellales bacterium]
MGVALSKNLIVLVNTTRSMGRDLKEGFGNLPKGCFIQLEKKASEYVLENIRSAFGRLTGLVTKLASFQEDTDERPTLSRFLEYYHLEIKAFYSKTSFSRLAVLSGIREDQVANGKDMQRYSDYLNFSIGFTTRGCFRKCVFCVNKKYDRVQRHAYVREFLDEKRPKIYLWDDNILGYPDWEEVIDELVETGKPFQFRQGIDLRLITEHKAHRLNQVKYYGDVIFAFDYLSDKDVIISKVQLWKRYSNKYPKMYILSAYNSQDEKDIIDVFERIHILMKFGCMPYIMRYEAYKVSRYKGIYIQIARWCNQPQFYKKMSFREFCERNQYYHPNPDTFCSAYRAMVDFEAEHPEIAQKYFDLKMMNENLYTINLGYGRRFCNKQECAQCKEKKETWDAIINGYLSREKVIKMYYEKEIDCNCLKYKNAECETRDSIVGKYLAKLIINLTRDEIVNIIQNDTDMVELDRSICIVPDHSTGHYIDLLVKIFADSSSATFSIKHIEDCVGISNQKERKSLIDELRIMALLDLIVLNKDNKLGTVSLSLLGREFMNLSKSDKERVLDNNTYRLPIVQYYLHANKNLTIVEEKMTAIYARNAKKVISFLLKV